MKKPNESSAAGAVAYLGDKGLDREERGKLLQTLLTRRLEETRVVQDYILEACEKRAAYESAASDQLSFADKLRELERGPARPGCFITFVDGGLELPHRRALVNFEDGTEACQFVPNEELASRLRAGDCVLVDSKAGAIIAQDGNRPFAGETATLERRVGDSLVYVRISNEEKFMLHASSILRKRLDSKEVEPGALLVVNIRQHVAFVDIPSEKDELTHFRFIDRGPLPRIAPEDVGAPNAVIADVMAHVSQEMLHPDIRRKYGLPRSFFGLLLGPPGTGKTHSLTAIETAMYSLIAQHLGMEVGDVPRRSMTLSIPTIISKYLGESDRNLFAFRKELESLCGQTFMVNGKAHVLPVLCKIEELDGLAKRRSDNDFDGGMSRIVTTFLNLYDPSLPVFSDSICIVLSTSNLGAQAVDPAALRRMGMRTYSFNRLTRRQPFESVLTKQLMRIPMAGASDQETVRFQAVQEISAWLFAKRDQDPMVILAYIGGASAVMHRRDFLTPALINRAVQSAAIDASTREVTGLGGGLQVAELMTNIDAQVRTITDQLLTPENARDYLDIPDGIRVATVKRQTKQVVQRHEAMRMNAMATDVTA